MTPQTFAFADDTKRGEKVGRSYPVSHNISPTSDNSDYAAYADLSPCAACSAAFVRQHKGHRFCSHACYSASLRLPIAARLWAKVNKNGPVMRPQLGPCWNWTGARTGSQSVRHGQITWRERYSSPQKVHRVVWELEHGPIQPARQINHHCDNPICVRLAHLYLGTQLENIRDASRRGRLHVPRTRTLSLFDRLTIYRMADRPGLGVELAARYGVTEACISLTRKGRFIGAPLDQVRPGLARSIDVGTLLLFQEFST